MPRESLLSLTFGDPGAAPVDLEEHLERGELVLFPSCPFPLPEGSDREFLLRQRLGSGFHKNISYDPVTDVLKGHRYQSAAANRRLADLMASFSRSVTTWLHQALPRYAQGCDVDRATLRPAEEALRQLRLRARNDLIHIDAFPTRPSHGRRLLRLYVNIHPTDPRVWATSLLVDQLLERYAGPLGLAEPARPWSWRWRERIRQLVGVGQSRGSYDRIMLQLHNLMKADDEFQERCPKRYWSFPPGSAWLLFADQLSHAVLRGRFALEHSFFVSRDVLRWPEKSPAALVERWPSAGRRAA
ncbi:MAG: Kdo hydroxylase family protein [Gemmataceae bacterium]|nr:Kdo hydroxylase family protein [Gemmataceae bacterium]MDW8263870.1 Kdo hydroxylase family protein [Gemmataceae bacterium]